MIAQVTGRVVSREPELVVLDVGGVALELVATRTAEQAASPGTTVTLSTHLHVREDALQLFGFGAAAERRLFRLLLGVAGIGPRLALAIVSALAPAQLERAVATGDVALLSSVAGVGKKTAQRICIDLRERIGVGIAAAEQATSGAPAPSGPTAPDLEDPFFAAREALVALGYSVAESELALEGSDGPTEERVRAAFGRLAAGGAR